MRQEENEYEKEKKERERETENEPSNEALCSLASSINSLNVSFDGR